MKILFLDIDGVLNSIRSVIAFANPERGSLSFSLDPRFDVQFTQEYFKLDPIAVLLTKRVIEETGAKIVISSTWRIGSCVEHFHKMFACYGWDTTDIIIDMTPRCGKIRGHEIAAWLENNNHLDITNYVIVDDNSDFLPEQKPHLVQTNMNIGFSHITYEQCIKILNDKNSANP